MMIRNSMMRILFDSWLAQEKCNYTLDIHISHTFWGEGVWMVCFFWDPNTFENTVFGGPGKVNNMCVVCKWKSNQHLFIGCFTSFAIFYIVRVLSFKRSFVHHFRVFHRFSKICKWWKQDDIIFCDPEILMVFLTGRIQFSTLDFRRFFEV